MALRTATLVLLALTMAATAQSPNDRLTRIEENTTALKEMAKTVEQKVEAIQKDLRELRDRVVAVNSQNMIIVSIAATAFTLGLAYLIWVTRKFESLQQQANRFEALLQQKAEGKFTDEDRQVLTGVARKILETEQRGHSAGSAS